MTKVVPLPSRATLHVVDALVLAWVALCITLGFWFASEIRDLRSLPTTLGTAGKGLENAGVALEGLPSIVGGESVERVGSDARQAGAQARASAIDAREGLDTLSTLTGLTVALVPTGALLMFYVPLRVASRRTRARVGPPSA